MSKRYIYTIFNTVNGKIYVGKTKDPQKRFDKHIKVASYKRTTEKFVIHKAIEKYGKDSFIFSILQIFNNEDDCTNAEKYWISHFNSNVKEFGYNLTAGGEGVSGRVMSEETKAKIRDKAIGRKHTAETLDRMSGESNHGSKLKADDIEVIRKICKDYSFVELAKLYNISARNISGIVYNTYWYDENYMPPSPRNDSENRKKTAEVGTILAAKRRKNLSEARIGKNTGVDGSFYGKHHTEEVKEQSRGENNKQAKLTADIVRNIRIEYSSGSYSQQKLANKYGISREQIGRIVRRVDWKHVE